MDVQSALLHAREKLQGALQKWARARQNSSSLHYSISALSAPLIIECVNNTGSRESVFFPTKPPTTSSTKDAATTRAVGVEGKA